jgi:hypothetical protein
MLLVLLLLYVAMRHQQELWTVPIGYVKLFMWAYCSPPPVVD